MTVGSGRPSDQVVARPGGKAPMTIDRSSVVRVPKAGELVAADLRRQIVTGELEPGEPLPTESVLMTRFGVSRPTLREAFRILESESIIKVLRGAHGGARGRPGRPPAPPPPPPTAARYTGLLLQYKGVQLSDVYQARTAIEVSAVGELASAPAKTLRVLSDLVERGGELLDDAYAFARHDTAVHQAIVDLAGNETLAVLASMLLHVMDAHNALFMSQHGEAHEKQADQLAFRAHKKLVKLVQAGDAAAAMAFWRKHLNNVERYMIGDSRTTLVEVLS
jgi:DNA-binding FadR family transcriptional regulator